jgi:hypothetical protein
VFRRHDTFVRGIDESFSRKVEGDALRQELIKVRFAATTSRQPLVLRIAEPPLHRLQIRFHP